MWSLNLINIILCNKVIRLKFLLRFWKDTAILILILVCNILYMVDWCLRRNILTAVKERCLHSIQVSIRFLTFPIYAYCECTSTLWFWKVILMKVFYCMCKNTYSFTKPCCVIHHANRDQNTLMQTNSLFYLCRITGLQFLTLFLHEMFK